MQAIVLAGGQGKRLRPLTDNVPKPLVKVLNKSLIEYTLDALTPHVDKFVIVIGYKGEKIQEYLGSNYKDIPITYVEQEKRLGTGHAMMLCQEHVQESFILMYADEIVSEKAISELAKHPASALAFRREDPENFGVFMTDENMMLTEVEEKPEKPRSNLCSAAAFKLTQEIFDHYPPKEKNGEYYLSDMIPSYLKKQEVKVVEADMWLTVNKPEDIIAAETLLKKETARV